MFGLKYLFTCPLSIYTHANSFHLFTRHAHTHIMLLLLILNFVLLVSSEPLNGVFIIDSIIDGDCRVNGPLIFDRQSSTIAIRSGAKQIGVGTIDNDNRLDLYLNEQHCKGVWNSVEHLVEIKCSDCQMKLRSTFNSAGNRSSMSSVFYSNCLLMFICSLIIIKFYHSK